MVGLRFATCHRILVPKSQVESILQCFGLIFILMDPLGALLNTLGANLLKSVFLETPCSICICIPISQFNDLFRVVYKFTLFPIKKKEERQPLIKS